ncbi:MAG: hypothetical protein N2234_09150 [Planctomycetota bacterium]|nr:hypothetical protein [Planctomycetota bacterium]
MYLRKKTVLILLLSLVGLLFGVNFVFGLFVKEEERMDDVDCIVALRRLSTALVDYALKNEGRYPKELIGLGGRFACEPLSFRCPLGGEAYSYHPIVSLDSPPDVPLLWCKAEHGSERTKYAGRSHLVVYSDLSLARVPASNLAIEKRGVEEYERLLEGDSNERLLRLRDYVKERRNPLWIRRLALWRMGEERREDAAVLMEPFLNEGGLTFEAAVALAKSKSSEGARELVESLKSDDYFVRRRALAALKYLTEEDFGYSAEIGGESQQTALKELEEWAKKRPK